MVGNEINIKNTNFYRNLARSSVEGPLEISQFKNRIQSWSFWVIKSLSIYRGTNRSYIAITLPGSYYQNNLSSSVIPHIEIKENTLNKNINFDAVFANVGNSLLSKYWLYSEIKALRNSLNSIKSNDMTLIEELDHHREDIITKIEELKKMIEIFWDELTSEIATSPEKILEYILADINDLGSDFKKLENLNYKITINSNLVENDKEQTVRRIGIWDVSLNDNQILTCVTPRLTKNSQFFSKSDSDSSLSLYIRMIQLKRIYERYNKFGEKSEDFKIKLNGYMIKLNTKFGSKIPEPSITSGINFIQKNTLEEAWNLINNCIETDEYLLLEKDEFVFAYNNVKNKIKKLEVITQDEVNRVLPLVMNKEHKLSRLTYGEK